GLLTGQLLDSGCGTGEQTMLAAQHGAEALGVDISPRAIERARAKAAERGVPASFTVADALHLGELGRTFDTIVDCGVFHTFDDEGRGQYVSSLAGVLQPGGHCYLMCFSDRKPGTFGPRRVRQDELRTAFASGWVVNRISAATMDINPGLPTPAVQAWLADIRRA
ncbi:MAG: class I SAM-dependent methyltransferase, partial [Streptosporangiaceae bacterium]